MKPPLGASLDPYFRHLPAQERTYGSLYVVILASDCQPEIVKQLEENFDSATKSMTTTLASHHSGKGEAESSARETSAHCLRHHQDRITHHYGSSTTISILCDVCYPFIHDPRKIQYIAAARWPGCVQPVLDEHNQRIGRLRRRTGRAGDQPEDMEIDENLRPPSADTRLRLGRLFKPTLTSALDSRNYIPV
jgi:origin recognition complex subunit 5